MGQLGPNPSCPFFESPHKMGGGRRRAAARLCRAWRGALRGLVNGAGLQQERYSQQECAMLAC